MSQRLSNQLVSWFIMIIGASVIAWFSYNTAWLADDINYMFSCIDGNENSHIDTLSDVFSSQYAHYFNTNGRFLPHIFVQLFCGIWGHTAFCIANGLMYIAFFFVLSSLCEVRLTNTPGIATVVVIALLTFQTKMTPSCQIGYIWTFTLTGLFLVLFFSKRKFSPAATIVVAIISFAAGIGQEAINIGIGMALIIYWASRIRTMTKAQYVMMVAFGLGALFCCLSPGTRSRAAEAGKSAFMYVWNMQYLFKDTRTIYLLLAVLLWQKFKGHKTFKQMYDDNAFYFNALFTLLIFNFLIGFGANRPLFGVEFLSIVISLRLLKSHSLKWYLVVPLALLLIWQHVWQAQFCLRIKDYLEEAEQQYKSSDDGLVYLNIDPTHHIPHSTFFSPFLDYYRQSPNGIKGHSYEDDCLIRYMRHKYPDRPDLRIIPAFLKGKSHDNLDNQIVEVSPRVLLLIQNKANPKKLINYKSISLPGFHREYEPNEIDIEPQIIYETPLYRAAIIDKSAYSVLGLSDERFGLGE